MFLNFGSLMFLFHAALINANEEIILNIENEYQPLVIAVSPDYKDAFAVPATLDSEDPKKLIFAFEDYQIKPACLLTNEQFKDEIMTVVSNDTKKCTKVIPGNVIPEMKVPFCGNNKKGVFDAIGHRVYMEQELKPNETKKVVHYFYIRLYNICYSDNHGTVFTMHELHPGKNVKPFKTWAIENQEHLEIDNTSTKLIQLVPFDDMTPMEWKYSTLIEVNHYSNNERFETSMKKINVFLRIFVNTHQIPLEIYSGVKKMLNEGLEAIAGTDAALYYWKVVEYNTKGMAFIIPENIPELYQPPCENICEKINLQELQKDIPNLLCCEVTESLMEKFGIILYFDNEPRYPEITQAIDFNAAESEFNSFKLNKNFFFPQTKFTKIKTIN